MVRRSSRSREGRGNTCDRESPVSIALSIISAATPICPKCRRPAHIARSESLTFVDCDFCSHYRIDDQTIDSVVFDPIPLRENAMMAGHNWEWPTDTYGMVNVRNMGRLMEGQSGVNRIHR